LRHTVATRVYARTGDLGVVQRVLGHASVATTQRYARCDEGAVRKAVGA
jgi:integrase/recombinase XerC